jgi:hypothetical protein
VGAFISDLWMMAKKNEITARARYHRAQLDRIADTFGSVVELVIR